MSANKRAVIFVPNEDYAGPQLQQLLEYLTAFGVARVTYPACEYWSDRVGERRNTRNSLYDTAWLMPRGDDGGFAERYLNDRSRRR